MRKLILIFCLTLLFVMPVQALEITAPEVPEIAADRMPRNPATFAEGLAEIVKDAMSALRPDLVEAARTCAGVIAVSLLTSLASVFSENRVKSADLVGTVLTAGILMTGTGSLIHLAHDTITELSEYGKLLVPVMTTALAAGGGVTSSGALYAGTAAANALLSSLISGLLIPLTFVLIALSVANGAIGEEVLKKLRDLVKWCVSKSLRTILYVFTGYMAVTGAVSGTTDAAALKATKLTISGMIPVVGGILSDASEAVLVSAGVVKNAAGIYGILAVLAVCLLPFLRIGVHYLLLKGTEAVCGLFAGKRITELIGDFSGAMGLLLAMTGSECLLLLISTVCFLRGVG